MNALKHLVNELDPILHERGRLAIVSVLAAVDRLTFTELRDALGMTDGNLSVHLQKLEEKGKWKEVQQLYKNSLFFKTLIDNCEMVMKKCFFPLTASTNRTWALSGTTETWP